MNLLIATTVEMTLRSFLLPFARHFGGQGWRVDCMASGASGSSELRNEFDHSWEAAWSRNPLAPGNLRTAVRQVRRLVEREGYDLVHVHTPVAAFVTRFALRTLRRGSPMKVVYTAHGFHFHSRGGRVRNACYRLLERVAGRWTDFLVVINREDEAAARACRLLPSERIVYMPGIGVDTRLLDPGRVAAEAVQSVRDRLGLSPRDRLFTMLASFTPDKRHPDAIRALAALDREDAHLALAGTGPGMARMRALAGALGVQQRVHFLGLVTGVAPLIRASTATLLTSKREGLARSVMESLSLAVPVVGTDARGVGELLEGGCGLAVETGDVPALTRALRRVLERPDEARAMGLAGRARMRNHDIRIILRQHEDLYARAAALGRS